MYKYILFDLDGTLTDSAPGIIRCVQYALEKYQRGWGLYFLPIGGPDSRIPDFVRIKTERRPFLRS
jgi:phosphoglycolate phosphatase-like HAD superfamily hydrolase